MFRHAVKEKSIDSLAEMSCIILSMSRIVVVKWAGGTDKKDLAADQYRLMLERGLQFLSNEATTRAAVRKFLSAAPVGIKTNCLARKLNSTSVALVDALSSILNASGFDDNDIVVWERSSSELERAGFKLNASSFGRRWRRLPPAAHRRADRRSSEPCVWRTTCG